METQMPTYRPSARELEILRSVAQHGTIEAAAAALFLSRHTIDWHLDNLRRKTGLRYLPQLVAWAAMQGHFGEALTW
jgi:DNA-binding CsgD family transcriptional regulator